MSTKNRIPVGLDRSNINSLFGLVGGYGTVVTVGIIAVLSVCAAFFIYRSFKGKRRKGCEKKVNKSCETDGEGPLFESGRDDDPTIESTEGSDDGGSEDFETDSSEAITLSTANTQMPSDLSLEDLRDTTHKTIPTEDHRPVVMSDASLRHSEGHVKQESGAGLRDESENVTVQPDLCEDQHEGGKLAEDELEVHLKESTFNAEDESDEAEPHADVDEPSETESAQETMEAKCVPADKSQMEDDLLDSTVSTPEATNSLGEEELPAAKPVLCISPDRTTCAEANCKTAEMEETVVKGLEKSSDCHIPQDQESGHCGHDVQPVLPSDSLVSENGDDAEVQVKGHQGFNAGFGSLAPTLSNTGEALASLSGAYEHLLGGPPQCYLGFATPSLVGEPIVNVSKERSEVVGVVPAEVSHDKNEINIMEAIMDSNEWLSTGPPETRDLPWLAQSNDCHGVKANTSSLTPSTSNAISAPSTDVSLLNPATTSKSYEEEDQSQKEKTEALTVTPEDAIAGGVDDEDDLQNKRVAAVSPMPQLVQVSFRVHYFTWVHHQLLAVTGNLRELGAWDSFVPLQESEGGFWAGTVALPAESHAEWKFILVEDGKIQRWEECGNRHLVVTGQEEEIHLNENWGCM
ncbi:uncharacterized protein stbd1 [Brachyhypopomus gauderio]|uniref:uncharacterized protein stbd1 n=1 Tax=Brachyhypopomus gauderio TaxID=698409 RepID=UPI0040414B92